MLVIHIKYTFQQNVHPYYGIREANSIGYYSDIHRELQSCEISFSHSLILKC